MSRGIPIAALLGVLGGVCTIADSAAAQSRPTSYAEYRADAIFGDGTSAQLGIGETYPLGNYVRLGLTGAAGTTWRDDAAHLSGRADAIARFTLDPLREIPYALSLGGGLSAPVQSGQKRFRPYLTAVIDVEGRARNGITPAVQLGLGGGARVGVVLRRSPPHYR